MPLAAMLAYVYSTYCMLFVVKSALMAIIVTVVVQLKVQVGGTYGVHTVLPA